MFFGKSKLRCTTRRPSWADEKGQHLRRRANVGVRLHDAPALAWEPGVSPGELGHGAETRAGGRRLVCSLALQLVTHSETATRPPCHVICVEQPPPPTVTAGRPHGGHGRFASSQSGEDGGLVQRVSAPCRGHTVQGLPRVGHVGEDTENNSPASREHTVPDRRLRSAGGGALP